MAIQQIVSVYLNLKGDAASSTFVFALQNLYQFANGIAVPFGGAGVVPTSITATNPPVAVTSVTVDANGNITLTTSSALPATVFTFQLDLTFNSGSSTSSSATQTTNVTVVGSSSVTIGAGSAVIGHVIMDSGSTTVVTGTVTVSGTVAATQSGTWTVQPGNTANTTPWLQTISQGGNSATVSAGGALKVDGSAATQPVSGTVTVTQATGTNLHAVIDSGTITTITNTVTVSGTVTANQGGAPWSVGGNVASGASDSGNPVKFGGVFNTTQPTVTTGQRVDLQSTARGAQIVATGVDTFTVAVSGTVTVSGTVASTQSGTWTVQPGNTANTTAWLVTGTGGTFPVTGTVAVTQSTTPWTVAGGAASGATKSGNPVQMGGVFNTTQPTVTTGQAVEAQSTARGAQIVATGTDTFNVTVNAALPAGTNVIGHVIADTGSTTAVTQATGTNLHMVVDSGTITTLSTLTTITNAVTVVGAAASGATKSGNPLQIGGVFNTTQPTVTTGQAVEAQSTARGAQIVSTGVDTFNVTVNAALPAGSNVIGHIIADSGSTTAVTGNVTVVQATGTNLHTVVDSGTITTITNTVTVSGTVTANIGSTGGITVAQASTTSGQSGPLVQGAVTTAAPTYTTGQTSPLSLDTTGALRITGTITASNPSVSTTGAAVPASATFMGVKTGANLVGLTTGSATSANSIPVVIASDQGAYPVTLTSTTVTGSVAVTQSTTPWTVAGGAASGATKSGNPVQIGGVFNTAQPTVTTGQAVEAQSTARGAQIVATGADTFNVTVNAALPAGTAVIGHVIADSGSTTAVTGNVTVVQATGTNLHAVIDSGSTTAVTQATGTNLHTVVDSGTITTVSTVSTITNPVTVVGDSASGATKAGNPVQVGGVFNTTQPTVTTGQTVEAQATARGGLIVATGTDTFNITVNAALPAGTNVIGHVIADTGSTTAVTGNVTVVQATGTNLHAVLDAGAAVIGHVIVDSGAITATLNAETTKVIGTTRVTGNIGGVMDAAGQNAASPANELLVAGQFNTTPTTITTGNVSPLQLDSAGNLLVNVKTGGTSGTVAQGSTTSGQSGMLVQGAVTTSAPTYTTAQTSPLSLDTSGNLRVAGTFAAGALPDATTAISLTAVAQSAQILCAGRNSFGFILTSVGTGGTVQAEGSIDGTNWFAIDVWSEALEAWVPGTINVTGQWWFEPIGSLNAVRIRVTAITSGTITGNLIASATVMGTFEYQTAPGQAVPPNIVAIGGSVTTAAPSYSTGTLNSLSLDTTGNLRVAGTFSAGALADLVGGAGTLNALNTTATINAFGYSSVGVFLAAGTLIGTIVPEASLDGGTTWVGTFFDDPATSTKVSSIVFASSNTATTRSIVGVAGASNYRVRVSVFTSGTASCTLRANETDDPSQLHSGPAGSVLPPTMTQMGGSVTTAAPSYTTATLNALSLTVGGAVRTDLASAASTVLGTPQAFGTAPTGVVIGTSSDIYVAGTRARSNQTTTAAGALDVNIVGALGVTNSATNGIFSRLTDNTTAVGVIAGTTALKTDLSSVAGTATVTAAGGVQKVGIVGNSGNAVDAASTQNVALPAAGVLTLGQFNTTPTTITTGNVSPLQLDSGGSLKVNATPQTIGGLTTTAGSIGATKTTVKASTGQVYGWYFYNSNGSVAYVQFFNALIGSVTLGTTAPFMSLGIPPGAGANVFNIHGIAYSVAISIAVTTTRAGLTGPTNTVDYNIFYL